MKRFQLHACPVKVCGGKRERWEAVCAICWQRLPWDYRRPITEARRARNRLLESAASIKAVDWLIKHPAAEQIARILGEHGDGAAPP